MLSYVFQKEEKINLLFTNKLNKLSTQLDNLIDKAIILNPLNLMSKGYAIAYQDEKVIDSVDNIKKDLPFIVRMKDGKVITRIEEIQKSEE